MGGHGSLIGRVACEESVNRPIRYEQVDVSAFSDMIGNVPIPLIDNNDVNSIANNITESIYNCVRLCSSRNLTHSQSNSNTQSSTYHDKWDQLLNDPDDSRVWKALVWKRLERAGL